MSYYHIQPSSLKGEIKLPSSKSQSLRAILFAALAKGKSKIKNYLPSPDIFQMIEVCKLLGAKIEITSEWLTIEGTAGKILHAEDVLNAGNSGIILRFCSAIGALSKNPIVITGDHSIRHQRPMKILLEGLSQLQVKTASIRGDNYAPVIVQGPIKPGKVNISGEDSQPVSALIIAAAFATGPIEIFVNNPGETPWITMTLYWLDFLKIRYERNGFEYYKLFGNAIYEGFEYTVPGDLSSAAFPIAAALIKGSELTLNNVDMEDPQGDKKLIEVFQKMGAKIDIEHRTLYVRKSPNLIGTKVDINDFIDAITVLAVVSCFAKGETIIYNASIAKQKECNRIACITKELKKMGADIEETEDGLIIRHSLLKGASLHSHYDHRMVMSLTVAAMGAEGDSSISSIECVAKTFPTFASDFKNLGANIEMSS